MPTHERGTGHQFGDERPDDVDAEDGVVSQLDQIQRMISTADPVSRADILRAQRDELQRRIAATQEALEIIDSVLGCRHADFTQCPNYRALITERVG